MAIGFLDRNLTWGQFCPSTGFEMAKSSTLLAAAPTNGQGQFPEDGKQLKSMMRHRILFVENGERTTTGSLDDFP
jgi:hypothetical protein